MTLIVGVTGLSCAGKATFCAAAAPLELPVVVTGDVLRREVARRGKRLTPDSIKIVSEAIRNETNGRFLSIVYGEARAALDRRGVCIVDSLREPVDLDILSGWCDRLEVVAVAAPEAHRRARMLARQREDDPDDAEGHAARDRWELGLGLGSVIESARHRIWNSGDRVAFDRSVITLLERLLATHGLD